MTWVTESEKHSNGGWITVELTNKWKWCTQEYTLAEGSKEIHCIYADFFTALGKIPQGPLCHDC